MRAGLRSWTEATPNLYPPGGGTCRVCWHAPMTRAAGLGLELAILALVPLVLAFLVFSSGYSPDPDAGFHLGCARLYAT